MKQKLIDLKTLYEERLEQQANMFNIISNNKEATFKNSLKLLRNKNKVLTKSIQRKKTKITNLKTLFQILKDKNILAENDAFKLSYEFNDLLVPLLQNDKRNKNKSCQGRRYSEEVKRFAVTMHYHSPKAYEYCRLVFGFACSIFLLILKPIRKRHQLTKQILFYRE